MAGKPLVEDAVAIVPVRNVPASVAFYCDVLGFAAPFVSDDQRFAILKHGDAALHLVAADDAPALQATANHIAVYLWVRGIDDLYAELEPRLRPLGADRVRQPFDQAYGMREFHVKDPDGCRLLFGEDNGR